MKTKDAKLCWVLHRKATYLEKRALEIFAHKIHKSGYRLSYAADKASGPVVNLGDLLKETIADIKKEKRKVARTP